MVYVTTNNFQIKNKLNGKYLTENETKSMFLQIKLLKNIYYLQDLDQPFQMIFQ